VAGGSLQRPDTSIIGVWLIYTRRAPILLMSIVAQRASLGAKIESPERLAAAARLNERLCSKDPFSFIRIGDFDLSLLEAEDAAESRESEEWRRSGIRGSGSPGLGLGQSDALGQAVVEADFTDFCDLLWPNGFGPLDKWRKKARATCHSRETSYILPTWFEHHFRDFCRRRRVLFCGAEAPILEELCRDPGYAACCRDFFEPGPAMFFLRPRNDGRNLAADLPLIAQDLRHAVETHSIDTAFISLGGAAKILCADLAKQTGIRAVDFGALMRSLCYGGSDGNRPARSTHAIFYFRVPFAMHMRAVISAFPGLEPADLLAKAHAQLLLELQCKEKGWSYSAWEHDFSDGNLAEFRRGLKDYRRMFRRLFGVSPGAKDERRLFLDFCAQHKLTAEARAFNFLRGVKRRFIPVSG